MSTNNPNFSPLLQYSERQLLVLILTELKLLTELISDENDVNEDLDTRRIEIMSSNDILTADGG